MNKKMFALFGLKWNPFAPDVPNEALYRTPRLESFAWRVEQLSRDGGFAAVMGEPGTGKSVTLRICAARLAGVRDVVVGVLTRPQAYQPGLAKNLARAQTMFALSNLYMARRELAPAGARCAL